MTPFRFPSVPPVPTCPYCGTGKPQVQIYHQPEFRFDRMYGVYTATCCGGLVLAVGVKNDRASNAQIDRLVPSVRAAAAEVPEPAKTFLQQAFETLHAPDAAAVMAGSAVDAMLKHFALREGSVYTRIDQAVEKHILTQAMGEWAHEVRLGANRPRHADSENPHVTPEQATQSVEFAEALGHFLFVLSSRVTHGVEAAKKAQ